jgi:acetyl-CoA acetyltransferase
VAVPTSATAKTARPPAASISSTTAFAAGAAKSLTTTAAPSAASISRRGGAEKFVRDGDNTYGGRVVTNPSGGMPSKGHPLGATELAQTAEIVWQLRGEAGERQVPNAKLGLQHNVGLGGACVVTVLHR